MFSLSEIWVFIIAAVGLTLTILNIIDKLTTMKKNANEPLKVLEQRVTVLEVKQTENETRFMKGNDQFRMISEYIKLFMQVQLAFVDFENAFCQHTAYTDTADLNKAKETLQKALTELTLR